MHYDTLLVEKANGIATVTLNRPPQNAVNEQLLDELVAAFRDIEEEPDIHVLILRSKGKNFSAGRELPGILAGREKPGGPRYAVLENIKKPVIAAVQGYCFTGSLELVMCADIIIAAENAFFGDTHARFGIIPGGGQTQRLPRIIGHRKAKELLFTSAIIPASEAERIGMINRVVPEDQLQQKALEIANQILKNIPETVSEIKSLINRSLQTDLKTGLELEASRHTGPICPTDEGLKRIKTFLTR